MQGTGLPILKYRRESSLEAPHERQAGSKQPLAGDPRPKEGEMRADPGLEEIQRTGEDLRYQFVSVELDLALTFVNVAQSRGIRPPRSEPSSGRRKLTNPQHTSWQR